MSKPLSRRTLWLLLISALGFVGLGILFEIIGWVLHWAPEPIGSRADLFKEGARLTLSLSLCSGSVGLGVGALLALAKLEDRGSLFGRVLSGLSASFIAIIRGTPLLVQVFFVYYALPALIPALKLNEFQASVLALALNVGAYNAEAIRAGILAVPRGQTEAARSLGLSKAQTLRWVVLPQAFRIVIPPLINNFVALLKDSSLVSSIGLLELTLVGNRVTSETYLPVPVLTTVACIYLVLTTVMTMVVHLLEKYTRAR